MALGSRNIFQYESRLTFRINEISFGFSMFSMQYIFPQTTLKLCHDNTIATLQGKYPEKNKDR